MGLWIKNSDGKPDATFTMAVIAFAIVTIKILLAGITIAFMGNEYSMGSLGADEIAAYLTPMFGTYAARRYTEKKYEKPDSWARTRADEDRESIS
jgi:hypothetical protein